MKKFYRVGNKEKGQGLWYTPEGEFTGLIHNKFKFCKNSDLPMPYDPNIIGWVSVTDKLEDLFLWFTKEDIKKLEEFGYVIMIYEAEDYKEYENHWVVKQDTTICRETIPVDKISALEPII